MKFDCGRTLQEKAADRWKAEKEWAEAMKKWHPYFAWYPKRVGSHDCRWLEWIECKGTWIDYGLDGCYWVWEYRAAKPRGKLWKVPNGA